MPDATRLTDTLCINIIKRVAAKHKIAPRLITTELMDEDDKESMRAGETTEAILDLHVKTWVRKGMRRYRRDPVA